MIHDQNKKQLLYPKKKKKSSYKTQEKIGQVAEFNYQPQARCFRTLKSISIKTNQTRQSCRNAEDCQQEHHQLALAACFFLKKKFGSSLYYTNYIERKKDS
jgi:hypothetical protein